MLHKMHGGFVVKSKKGKKLSRKYKTESEALKRLREIEHFASQKKG